MEERIEEWIKRYPNLQNIFIKLQKYLHFDKEIVIVPWEYFFQAEGPVLGITYMADKCTVSFRYVPPDEVTFVHEMIHCAGGNEFDAYNLTELLLTAIEEDWPPFDALKLMDIPLDEIEKVIRKLYDMSIDEFFDFQGIIPLYKTFPTDDETKREQIIVELLAGLELPMPYKVVMELVKTMREVRE